MVTNIGEVTTNIGGIVKKVPFINPFVKNKEVDKLFTDNPNIRGLVVVHHEKPVAHITRTHFYQKIGTLYGYNLYMGRESKLLAKNNPLIVDYYQSITEVSRLAMEREEEDLYDDVIVTKEEKFIGVVSIRALLMKFVEIQVEFASFLNPLSNLPGNHLINQTLAKAVSMEQFSLLYFDLDYFKTYNDLYGFNKGDQILLHLTDILKRHVLHNGDFLGHIGGDDFMALVPHYNIEPICENIITEFDETIADFYNPKHLSDSKLKIKGRLGEMENLSIMSLSIAVLTNKHRQFEKVEDISNEVAAIKRYCKKIKGSCYIIDNSDSFS